MIVEVALAANDNALKWVRPLSVDDLEIILFENGPVLGSAVDGAARYEDYIASPSKAVALFISKMPDLQRSIVWRGSWLKEDEVKELQENGSLVVACSEVIKETVQSYDDEELHEIIREQLKPFSRYLRQKASA